MAWVIKCSAVSRFLNVSLNQSGFVTGSVRGLFLPQLVTIQAANISGKALRDKSKKRPPPFPYKTKSYNFWRSLFDNTTWRFDENSKIITVEGPIGVGKSTFAKVLAEDLDMLYLPECNMDSIYITEYGLNLRELDPKLPESVKSFDVKNFYENPHHQNVAGFQFQMYALRYEQYLDALNHVLNTGQGVVLERSAYSDFVFLEAMHKCGYISKSARSFYYDVVKNTLGELMKPHLIIYLDISVAKVQERIKKRNISYEVNSNVLSPTYLKTLEEFYKQRFLKEMSSDSELLVYDWSDFGDVEVVVEDIERIDFDQYGLYDTKLQDWRLPDEQSWNDVRMTYNIGRDTLRNNFNVPRLDVPEMIIPAEDILIRDRVFGETPGLKYINGYNADKGDTGILFKMKLPKS